MTKTEDMTKEEFTAYLYRKVASGEMTIEEAEDEYQDRYNPEPRFAPGWAASWSIIRRSSRS